MKHLLLALLAGCTGGGQGNTSCGPSSAVVMRVIDGDTVELADGTRVRYLLMDAPETTLGHDDCFGSNAVEFNTSLVMGKTIDLVYDEQCTDMYGRLLAYISVDGTDVNATMVQRGYACVLYIPPDGKDRYDEFKMYQADAKANLRGAWGACDPLPPACK